MTEKARVAVLISGRGSNMEALIAAAGEQDCPYRIVLVASNNPDAGGLATARAAGIATFAHPHQGLKRAAFDAIIDRALRDAGVEAIALAGYMRILSEEFIRGWDGRILNIHPSLLPKYKGLDTHQRAIEAGDAEAGCSVHVVTPTLDDGPVIAQACVAILPGDTPESLAARILIEEHRLYPATLATYIRSLR
jgi:phosphoribosylglycinamide formyltransferase-1